MTFLNPEVCLRHRTTQTMGSTKTVTTFDFSRGQMSERGKVEAGSFEGTLPRFFILYGKSGYG